MPTQLITLLGNDQRLKDSIFSQYIGIDNQNGYIPLPYSNSVLSNVMKDSYYKYQILNTPSTNQKEELISMWNNLIQISKLDKIEFATIIYCFMDSQNDIQSLLNNLHTEMNFMSYQDEILLLTSSLNLVDQECNITIKNAFQCIQIDPAKPQAILQQIKKKKCIRLQNLGLQIQQENKSKQIALDICNTIFSEMQEVMENSKIQADFIKYILQEQFFSQILKKANLNFLSEVSLFNIEVYMREILSNKEKDFSQISSNYFLQGSNFYYCQNKECMWLYNYNSSYELEQLCKIQIQLYKKYNSNIYCPTCQRMIYFNAYQEFQFRIIDEISQTYQQQDSNEILQIMFLSNEEDEKKKMFNKIQENSSTEKPRSHNKFDQSSIINGHYRFHNPPIFDFEKDRENTITTFRDYFCKNAIHFFFIIVKYERTDIMIQRITNIVKKIFNLDRLRIALIVNQCQCEQQQKLELESRLAYFGFKTIKFFSNDSSSDICRTLFQTLENVETKRFDFTNTIFEQENDSSDQQSFKENLINMSRQIDEEQKNNFRMQLAQEKEYLEQLDMEIKMLEETIHKKKSQQRDLSNRYKQDQQKLYDWEKQLIKFKH